MDLIDTHAHVNLYYFLDPVLEHARANSVTAIQGVAMSAASQEKIIALAERHPMIHPALGIHPEEVRENPEVEAQLPGVKEYITAHSARLSAIGEIGLDHHFVKDESLWPRQTKIFHEMLGLAQKLRLPVTLHVKGAEPEVFDILPAYDLPHVTLHWYTGPEALVKAGVDRGYSFSVTPAIEYSPGMQRTARLCPVESLLLESDGPVKYSGVEGRPGDVRRVLTRLADLKGVPEEALARTLHENTRVGFPRLCA